MKVRAGAVQQHDQANKKTALPFTTHPFAQIQKRFGNLAAGQILQTKLASHGIKIHPAGDKYEREADEIADRVIERSSNAGSISPVPHLSLQRKCHKCEEEEETLIQRKCEACEELKQTEPPGAGIPMPSILQASKGNGTSLPAHFRTEMEVAFGAGFQQVRIHTGPMAVRMNEHLRAQAFTHGRDIYFNEGKYDPASTAGRRLLAHELAHVIQQHGAASGTKGTIQKKGREMGGSSTACEPIQGSTTVTYKPDLGGESVRVDYRTEFPDPNSVPIPYPDLHGNVFGSAHPLVEIVVGQACSDWIRFDVTDSPPGFVGPTMTDEVSMTIWGRNTDMGLVFTGLPWVFDYITAQRPRQTEESFDEEVIFAFFRGVGEGAGSGLAQNMETLIQTYKRHALFLPILQFKLWQGALDGIAEEAANTLFFITQFASDPMRQSTEITKAIRHTLTALYEQPQSTFFDFGKALGKDFSKKVEGLITPENQESPGHFLYDLGKLVGPVLLNILLSIIQPEFVLRFGLTVGENLLRFVKGFVDLKAIASASAWKALALDAVDLGFLSKTKSIGILTDPGDIKREMGIVFKVAPREVTEGLKSRFDFEISLGEGHHTWRGTKDGTWCRFTDEKCYLIRPGQYGRGEPDLMETDPRLTKDRPMPDVATQRRLEAGVSEYERTLRKRVSRVVAAPEGQKTIFRRSGHAALDMELIRRGYTLDLDGWQLTMEARFPSQSIDLDMRIGASPEYPTNRQRMRNGLPAYLDPEHMIEIHHVEQDFFRTQEISSSYHYLSHEELHPYFGDLSYVSWRREMAWFEGSVRTLEDIYSILSRRYWRARLAELEP